MLTAGAPSQVAYFHTLACLGHVQLQRYDDALRDGIAARALALASRRWRMVARAENCLMRVYRILGHQDLAYQAGRATIAALDREPGARTIEYRAFFAHVLASLRRRQEAIEQLHRVIREADTIPVPANADQFFIRRLESAKADALEQIGLILLRDHELAPAEQLLVEAFRIRRLSDPGKLNWSYNSLGELRMAQKRPAEAARLWNLSVADRFIGFPPWFAHFFRAKANLALDKPAEALRDLLAAIESVRDLRLHLPLSDDIQIESESSLHNIFSLAVETAAGLGNRDLAFAIAVESRAHSLRARTAAGSAWRRRLPSRYWTTLDSLRRAQSAAPSSQTAALRRDLAEMESAAGLEAAAQNLPSAPWQALAASLPPQDRLTFFYLLDTRSLRWTIESGQLRQDWIAPKAQILSAADEFRDAVHASRPQHRDLGSKLHRAILDGYAPLPSGAVWTILPDDRLFQVPMAALTHSSTGRYLIEDHAIRLAAAVSLPLSQPSAPGGLFAAFADPISNRADGRWNRRGRWWSRLAPSSRQEVALPRLSGSMAEVERCARVWSKGAAQVLAGQDLLRTRILPPRAAVLHFATHMVAQEGSPDTAPVIFLGLGDTAEPVTITETDIEALQMAAGLVTLSGCGSGTGRLAPGAGLLGLTRAWLMAGANGVLASLWAVPDGSGALFERFYKSLQTSSIDSRTAAISLASAQAGEIGRSHVSVWGAYFVMGLAHVGD